MTMAAGMTPAEYDAGWDTKWDDMKRYGPMSRHVRRIIKKLIKPLPFHSVMDVGCGQGSLLLDLMCEYPGMAPNGSDFSPTAVEMARKKVPQGQFDVLDLEKTAPAEQYDLVICSEVLEHIVDDVTAIRNLERMTGGHLVVTTVQGRMRSFEKEVGHVRNYERGELVTKLRAGGFDIIRVVQFGFPFYSPLYRDLLNATGSSGTTGEFGPMRKLVATALYYLFHLNATFWGDEIFVLARPRRVNALP
jgi:SAM-dependent methyltransferase